MLRARAIFSNSATRTSKIFSYDGAGDYLDISNYVVSSQVYTDPSQPPCNNNDPVVITGGSTPTFSCGGSCVPTPNVILPVNLIDFQARKVRETALLTWATAGEQNNDYFAIERSADGRSFTEVGRVHGSGTTDAEQYYSFTDEAPLPGLNYYRLRQVDFDGAQEVHRVVVLKFNTSSLDFQLSPVPALSELRLDLFTPTDHPIQLAVMNMTGQVVMQAALPAGVSRKTLAIGELAAGQYLVRLTGKETMLKRFFKF